MNRIVRAALEIFRLAVARDTLAEAGPASARADAPPRGGLVRAVFARETLEVEPPAGGREPRPILRWLLAPEELPFDPEPPRARRRGRLAALLAPEKLDDSP